MFLAAIRIGDPVTDLLIGAYVVTWLDAVLRGAFGVPSGPYAKVLAGLVAFVFVSYLSLVFADLVPNSIALAVP